ncbi:hypothetical protein [Stieleria varia]|nr:hypothetical protein [Stieleria varia]
MTKIEKPGGLRHRRPAQCGLQGQQLSNASSIGGVVDFARNPVRKEFWRIPLPDALTNGLSFLKSLGSNIGVTLGCRAMLVLATAMTLFSSGFAEEHKCCRPKSDGIVVSQAVSRFAATNIPERIVIVRPRNRQDRVQEQDGFAEAIASELRATRLFDVVITDRYQCNISLPMRRGVFDEHQLVALSIEHQADAVLYCDVERFSGYDPMRLEFSMLLVNINDAVALVSTSATVDLQNPVTGFAYKYFAATGNPHEAMDIHRHTPSRFIDFAAARAAKSIASVWGVDSSSASMLR